MNKSMMRLAVALFALTLSSGVLAFGCPNEIKKIDEALEAGPDLTGEQMTEVHKLRSEAEILHGEGKHQESMDKIAEAKQILEIE